MESSVTARKFSIVQFTCEEQVLFDERSLYGESLRFIWLLCCLLLLLVDSSELLLAGTLCMYVQHDLGTLTTDNTLPLTRIYLISNILGVVIITSSTLIFK